MEKNKTGNNDENTNNSRSVPWVGIEPTLPKELDFESSASTNSATKAIKASKLTIVSSLQKFLRFLIVNYPSQFNTTLLYLIIMNIF